MLRGLPRKLYETCKVDSCDRPHSHPRSPHAGAPRTNTLSSPGWAFEEKYDGIRILANKGGSEVTLLSRNNLDRTATFADIATAIGQLRDRTVILDGEVVAFDSKGVCLLHATQRRGAKMTGVLR
jgi:bifunctional non-homologous end joining protein LigD